MAEEMGESAGSNTGAFDEAKLADLIKSNVSASMQELTTKLTEQQQQQAQSIQSTQVPAVEPDFWDTIIDPKVNKKVSAASMQAEAAQDQVNFYTSDEWLVEADSWLTEEDPDKRRAEKSELRANVEKYFSNMLKSGRGVPRADIFNAVLGEKIKKDKIKYEEGIGKRYKAKEVNELEKARKGVDMGSVMNDFTPELIYNMDWDKVTETYGKLVF